MKKMVNMQIKIKSDKEEWKKIRHKIYGKKKLNSFLNYKKKFKKKKKCIKM